MVTKAEAQVYDQVRERDLWMIYLDLTKSGGTILGYETWKATARACVAPLIDSSQWGNCSGEQTFDHVWEHAGGTKGKRPPTTLQTVACVCQNHHLWTNWITAHRPEERTYIKEANELFFGADRDQS
jgi:hypothetical protein